MPPDLQCRITPRAPFVMVLKDARYDKQFYHEVAGLCALGLHPHEVIEEMMPRSKWALKWGEADHASNDPLAKIWVKDVDTNITQEQYELLYTKVYGNKPDNGSLTNFS